MQQEISEQHWKESTNSANGDFFNQRYDAALTGYKRALAIAEALLERATSGSSAPLVRLVPIFVVSCHNLADCYQRLNEPAKKLDCLQGAHYRLLALCRDQGCPASLRQRCLCDLSKTLMALVECLREQKPENIIAIVSQTKAVAAALLPDSAMPAKRSFH